VSLVITWTCLSRGSGRVKDKWALSHFSPGGPEQEGCKNKTWAGTRYNHVLVNGSGFL
jgi:hypothetical protein